MQKILIFTLPSFFLLVLRWFATHPYLAPIIQQYAITSTKQKIASHPVKLAFLKEVGWQK